MVPFPDTSSERSRRAMAESGNESLIDTTCGERMHSSLLLAIVKGWTGARLDECPGRASMVARMVAGIELRWERCQWVRYGSPGEHYSAVA